MLWTLVCGYLVFAGAGGLDSSMVESSDAYAAGAGLGMIAIFIFWGVVVAPLSLIGLLFKRS
jgi:hypothetical protein